MLDVDDLPSDLEPQAGWPGWVVEAPYDGGQHPEAFNRRSLRQGANCQTYAYALLSLQRRTVPPLRSGDLWSHPDFEHPDVDRAQNLDLALFNEDSDAWGAHVGVESAAESSTYAKK